MSITWDSQIGGGDLTHRNLPVEQTRYCVKFELSCTFTRVEVLMKILPPHWNKFPVVNTDNIQTKHNPEKMWDSHIGQGGGSDQ